MAHEFPHLNEPLPDPERTHVRPRPGARSAASAAWPPDTGAEPAFGRAFEPAAEAAAVARLPSLARNRLLACARPLLSLVPQLRSSASQPDPEGLRESLAAGVREFEQAAHSAGIARDAIIAARYVLCTFLDETIAATPWGSGGAWAGSPLLVRFHNETWGGEKVFALLSKLAQEPAKNRDLLELAYYCLALGFQGRYGAMPNGRAQVAQVRERLYELLRRAGIEPETSLSTRWAPAMARSRRWLGAAPFWAFGAVLALVSLVVYSGYSIVLARRSDPVFASVQAIRLPTVAPPQPAPPAPRRRLAELLESDVRDGLVTVRDEATRSVVSILGDDFFAPGSASVPERKRALLARIGQALSANPGAVLVSGHTDSAPIRSARFPSNWHLSQERARAVEQVLAESIGPGRITSEGRADSEPIAPNDTAAGRARNRRVEVTLFVAPQ